LKKAFDFDDTFPKNAYKAKKIHRELGLSYVKFDACQNDCILYWKEYENGKKCPKYAHPWWKEKSEKSDDSDHENEMRGKGKHIPYKVLHYFPLVRSVTDKSPISKKLWDGPGLISGGTTHPSDRPFRERVMAL